MADQLDVNGYLDGGADDRHWITVSEIVKPGNKIKLNYGNKHNPNNMILHILTIVDECHVVFKKWLKHKKRWHYEVEPNYFFFWRVREGVAKKQRK